MKVLQVGLGNNPGGVEAFVMNYYRKLSDNGVQFDFVCMYETLAYEEEIRMLGGNVFFIPNIKRDYFGYVRGFHKLLEEQQYDVVHVNMLSAANVVPLRLSRQAGVKKVVAHSHNASTPGIIRKIMHGMNRNKIGKYANVKLACGEKAAVFMFGEEGKQREKVSILQNAIDVEKYLFSEKNRTKLRGELGWDRQFVIGHVGRFDIQKNHAAILEIFREVKKMDDTAVLCLIGDGELRPDIEEKIQKYKMTDAVYFAGVRDDVEKYLSAMDVFLLPSLFEGLPFVLVEAQANGLPCVVADTVSSEAFLTEDIVSLPLEEQYSSWAKKILQYKDWKRPDSRKTSERLKEAHFDISVEAKRLISLYQE